MNGAGSGGSGGGAGSGGGPCPKFLSELLYNVAVVAQRVMRRDGTPRHSSSEFARVWLPEQNDPGSSSVQAHDQQERTKVEGGLMCELFFQCFACLLLMMLHRPQGFGTRKPAVERARGSGEECCAAEPAKRRSVGKQSGRFGTSTAAE